MCYPAGFSPNYLYELVYVGQDPMVMGIGFAATRDLVSFLRRERSSANPLLAKGAVTAAEDPLRWAIGFGRSQSGRYIKDLVYQGFNLDEGKRVVFDGILPLISGSRLTYTNVEFAMPGRAPNPLEAHFYGGDQFPHTYATVYDPISKKRDGWLARCTGQGACPKVMHWDSGHEAWGGGRNSLVVADGLGKSDLPIPENVRLYYFASTQHVPTLKPEYGICKNLSNPNPYREAVRALFTAMQAWIVDGKLPPASRFPRVSDGTLVPPMPEAAFGFPKIPGVTYTGKHNELHIKDFSVQPPQNIPGTSYTVLVPKVDADGNDIAGVRSVTLQVPLSTYTGWNQRRAGLMENEFCGNCGCALSVRKDRCRAWHRSPALAAGTLRQPRRLRCKGGRSSSKTRKRRFFVVGRCGATRAGSPAAQYRLLSRLPNNRLEPPLVILARLTQNDDADDTTQRTMDLRNSCSFDHAGATATSRRAVKEAPPCL